MLAKMETSLIQFSSIKSLINESLESIDKNEFICGTLNIEDDSSSENYIQFTDGFTAETLPTVLDFALDPSMLGLVLGFSRWNFSKHAGKLILELSYPEFRFPDTKAFSSKLSTAIPLSSLCKFEIETAPSRENLQHTWDRFFEQQLTKPSSTIKELYFEISAKSGFTHKQAFMLEIFSPVNSSQRTFLLVRKSPYLYKTFRIGELYFARNIKFAKIKTDSNQRIIACWEGKASQVSIVSSSSFNKNMSNSYLENAEYRKSQSTHATNDLITYTGTITKVLESGCLLELDASINAVIVTTPTEISKYLRPGMEVSIQNAHIVTVKSEKEEKPLIMCCPKTSLDIISFNLDSYCDSINPTSGSPFFWSLEYPASCIIWQIENLGIIKKQMQLEDSDSIIRGIFKKLLEQYFQLNKTFVSFYDAFMQDCGIICDYSLSLGYPVITTCEEVKNLKQSQTFYRSRTKRLKLSRIYTENIVIIGLLRMNGNGMLELVDASGTLMVRTASKYAAQILRREKLDVIWAVGISEIVREKHNLGEMTNDTLMATIDSNLSQPLFKMKQCQVINRDCLRAIVFVEQVSTSSNNIPPIVGIGLFVSWGGTVLPIKAIIVEKISKIVNELEPGCFYEVECLKHIEREKGGMVSSDSILELKKLRFLRSTLINDQAQKVSVRPDVMKLIESVDKRYRSGITILHVHELLKIQVTKGTISETGLLMSLVSIVGEVKSLDFRLLEGKSLSDKESIPLNLAIVIKDIYNESSLEIYVDLSKYKFPHGFYPGEIVLVKDIGLKSSKTGFLGLFLPCSSIKLRARNIYEFRELGNSSAEFNPSDMSLSKTESENPVAVPKANMVKIYDFHVRDLPQASTIYAYITSIDFIEFSWKCRICGGIVRNSSCPNSCSEMFCSEADTSTDFDTLNEFIAHSSLRVDDGTSEAILLADTFDLIHKLLPIERRTFEDIKILCLTRGTVYFDLNSSHIIDTDSQKMELYARIKTGISNLFRGANALTVVNARNAFVGTEFKESAISGIKTVSFRKPKLRLTFVHDEFNILELDNFS